MDLSSLHLSTPVHVRQGFLVKEKSRVVRVRVLLRTSAYITIKGESHGITRPEFEYSIPLKEAEYMLENLCSYVMEKTRSTVSYMGFTWEIDVFSGKLDGLRMAEVELEHEDDHVPLPPWVGLEVSSDSRYFNAVLAEKGIPEDSDTVRDS